MAKFKAAPGGSVLFLTVSSIALALSVAAPASAQLAGLWRFDDNVDDASANNNDGALVGFGSFVPYVTDVPTQIGSGKALTIEFQGEGAEVPDSSSLDIEGDITISVWQKSDNNLFFGSIANKGPANGTFQGAGTPGNYEFRREASSTIGGGPNDPGQLTFLYNIAPTGTALDFVRPPGGIVPANEWSHVAVTVKQGTPDIVKFYVNGVLAYQEMKNSPTPLYTNSQPLRIGTRGDGLPSKLLIDELSIWNVALSASQIAILASGPTPTTLPPGGVGADFNGDEIVDGQDFLIWQRGVGVSGAIFEQGDANNNGVVDGADLAIFTSQFGGPPSLAAASTSVPEPASACLVGLALLAGLMRRRAS